MPTFETAIEFEVFCARCGAGLCNNSETSKTSRRGMLAVTVTPCKKCDEDADEAGYDRGRRDGEAE